MICEDMTRMTYETGDAEEREMTLAFHDLFMSIAESGATSDPMALICRSLVRCIENIQLAFYAYDDDEEILIPAKKEGLDLWIPPPDVSRKYVAHLRKRAIRSGVAVVEASTASSFLPPSQRKKWTCYRSCVIRVNVEGMSPAILAASVPSEFAITDRHVAWMRLVGEAAEALLSRYRNVLTVKGENDLIMRARRNLVIQMESFRERVRQHLLEMEKVRTSYLAGSVSLQDAYQTMERSAKTLYSLSNVTTSPEGGGEIRFNDAALEKWVGNGLKDSRIKAVVGVRGSGKSPVLQAVRSRVLSSGASESHVVVIDFEDARFRRFKTPQDVIDYLAGFPKSEEPYYLFLDEIGMIGWHAELLRCLVASRQWNVWMATSTAIPVTSAKGGKLPPISIFRMWTNPRVPRSRADLERIWCQLFMRDVVCGIEHPDLRAKELLAEYCSDHLGEVRSLRDIVAFFKSVRYPLSRSTVSSYRQALVDAYLIEISEIYDIFAEEVVTSVGGRVFYTDLELRMWRYGMATEHDEKRVALNRLYLELRQKYAKVYTPKNQEADFVTFGSNGKPCLWSLPPDRNLPLQTFVAVNDKITR